jgi:2-keto-4-pentenoate hydratase/2-oxohepta-3-ene-1,7-dioic acid hydratase in catechol pathway
MTKSLMGIVFAGILVSGCVATRAQAQAGTQEPFKLGTFEQQGRAFLGMVLRDTQIVDIAAANAAYEGRNSGVPKLAIPGNMRELIVRYEASLKERLYAIAGEAAGASTSPPYAYRVSDVKVLPPVRPAVMLNAAVNYQAHGAGIEQQRARSGAPTPAPASPSNSAPGIWERTPGDERGNPYLFMKLPAAIIASGEPIRAPMGRERIDHECEFAVVVGKPAKHVPLERAADYIFGYTIQNDVSDRGGRGDSRFGSDWLVGKNHDTFAPLGPYIVPKEFVQEPMSLRQVLTLNGEVKQDSNTRDMTHNIYELLHYGSNILTLQPGDIIAGGSPAGTNIERAQPRWMRPGDTVVCTIEGIGALTSPVIADSR